MKTATQACLALRLLLLIGAIALTNAAIYAATAPAFEWIKLQENASSADAVNIIISGEGYTSSQKTRFLSDAQIVMNAFVNKDPWKTYISHVNFYAGWVVSNQEGISTVNGITPVTTVDTAFKGTLDTSITLGGLDLDYNLVFSYISAVPVTGTHIFIVNSTINPGRGMGGTYAVFLRDDSSVNNVMTGSALHELGHSFAKLSDEYTGGGLLSPGKNVTTDLNNIPWSLWLDAGVQLPTPDTYAQPYIQYAYTRVGAFQGAYVATAYRPTYTSMMRGSGAGGGEYGPVNTEAIILAIYSKTGPMISVAPAAGTVRITSGQQQIFTPVKWSAPTTITTKWYINNNLYASTDTLTLRYADLTPGQYTLKCVIKDETTMVRNDPQNLTTDTTNWTVIIGDLPQITQQPSSTTVTAGQSASFSITATGSSLTYQWRKGGTAIAGATAATYTISSTSTADAGSYDCVVTNSSGSATSSAASLTVNAAPSSGGGGGGGACETWYLFALSLCGLVRYRQKRAL